MRVLFTEESLLDIPSPPYYCIRKRGIAHLFFLRSYLIASINHNIVTFSLYFLSTFNAVYIDYYILPELGNIQCPVHIDCSINVTNNWHFCSHYYYILKSNHQKALLSQVFLFSSIILKFLGIKRFRMQCTRHFLSWGVAVQN